MKQYKIEITKEALRDMEEIYNYITDELLSLMFCIVHLILKKN